MFITIGKNGLKKTDCFLRREGFDDVTELVVCSSFDFKENVFVFFLGDDIDFATPI
jgi:hypothetical protein